MPINLAFMMHLLPFARHLGYMLGPKEMFCYFLKENFVHFGELGLSPDPSLAGAELRSL